ncbi:hypothetical protein L3Q82_002570 [Scortum barcoo]|uniref:Uncharacterized protein n=1 Tax=Scortum barcoo TaxID=214431 RepID=A0ACB8VV47_9TELE|nr:hypothetical protein L3Q82_002570 [Scortum barcoo]
MKALERIILRHLRPLRSLSHLEDAGNTVRITFFDFSSAFNTIHPSLLRVKLERAGASDQLAAWVTNYLTDRPQFVRLQDCVSDVVVCSTEGNDCEYRKVIMDFVDWCELNHLQANASKTKEMVIDFSRKPSSDIAPVNIQGLDIERVRTYKPLLRTFYETVVASVVSYAVVCWGGGCSERDKKRLNRLIKRASSVCGCPLDSIEVMGERRALAKLSTIIDNTSHPLHQTVGALSSSFSNRLRHPQSAVLLAALSASLGPDLNTTSLAFSRDQTSTSMMEMFEALNSTPAEKEVPRQEETALCLASADVQRTLKRVKTSKAPGPDNIPGRVLRECADQLACVLTDIFNTSDHIISKLPPTFDPLQFAYRPNRSTEDAICSALHLSLTHLEEKNTITIIPQHLVGKLLLLGFSTPLCNWLLDFPTERPQSVRVGKNTSSVITLSTGSPQGCVLSPLLFTLMTHDCVPRSATNHIVKICRRHYSGGPHQR